MRKKIIKITFLFVFLLLSFIYSVKWLDSINIKLDSETLDVLIQNSNNLNRENIVINSIIRTITDSRYDPVSVILNKYSSISSREEFFDDDFNNNDSVVVIENKPVVYIYNTHQTEKYSSSQPVNVNFSVLDASYLLQEELKKYDINSIVESGSIKDILDTNNWKYASSYKVSRMYLENAKKKNSSLEYFIDLHRDSVNKSISTVTINGKKYARTMFLLGLENPSYASNQKVLESLENWLDINYQGLSRGIYEKKGAGVNGIYNQDFSSNCILIEVGGSENTTEEVYNTIEVLAKMLDEYMGDKI